AYRLTHGMKLQQNVQAVYMECKEKIEIRHESV
ncbi:DNA recombinase, partial [Escherichia coli]|nr:DNA recombinase [Escherichia coli]